MMMKPNFKFCLKINPSTPIITFRYLDVTCQIKQGTKNTFLYSWWLFKPTHLKNMRKPNWIISPNFGMNIPKDILELATTNLQSSQSFAWTSEDQRYGRYHLASPSHKMAAVPGTFRARWFEKKKRPKKIFEKSTTGIRPYIYIYNHIYTICTYQHLPRGDK